MGRENNTFKPAGSGHCGKVRLTLDALAIDQFTTITPDQVGALSMQQVLDGLAGSRANLAKRGKRFTHMKLDDGYWVRRTQ